MIKSFSLTIFLFVRVTKWTDTNYVWVEGRWVWDDYYRRDVWVEGYWMLREREYYCDRRCCQKHDHHYKKRKHGYAYGRHKNKHHDDDDDDYDD